MAKRTKRARPDYLVSPTETVKGGLAIPPRLREEAAKLETNNDYERARQSILNLTGTFSRALLGERRVMPLGYVEPDLLTILVCSVLHRTPAKRQLRETAALRFARMNWRALDSLPERIENIASEIEHINRGPLAPERQSGLGPAARNFHEVPGLMRMWAKGLRERIQKFPFYHRQGALPLDWLQSLVNEATGEPHHKLASDLLSAAQIALGKPVTFDEVTLAQYWSRREPDRRITVSFS
ncbi:MAG: hypothetical protein KGL75_00960 [Acidobacteriota bacterium]|nr:hypothetical protein [Acidobacteriota bacterium]